MRISEFWELVNGEFGPAQGSMLVHEHVLFRMGNRTAEQALAAGESVRDVWLVLCEATDVPPERWLGVDQGRDGDGRVRRRA